MSKKSGRSGGFNRREFLKAAACGLCLAGISGYVYGEGDPKTPLSPTAQKGLMKPIPGRWFSMLDDKKVQCKLCPMECELADGKRAPCRVRENRGGKGYTLAYGNPVLIQEDPVERKPFFHVVPGSRALSVATAGCNLNCNFCEVWDMALVHPEEVFAYDIPPQAVVEHAQAARVRAVSYAFGEPVVFYEYMLAVAELAKKAGLLNLMHTAGYIRPEPLKELVGKLDAVNVDLKGFDSAFYREVVGGELEPVLGTLKLLKEAGVHIEITNIVIPTLNDDKKMIEKMCKWIVDELGAGVPVHFARFYPLFRLSTLPRTPVSTLDMARETALKAGLKFVYVARVTGHEGENTFCPACGKVVIKRVGFWLDEMHLENGNCKYCGSAIPGRWT